MKIKNYPMLSGLIGLFATTLLSSSPSFAATATTKDPIKQTRAHFHALLEEKPGFYPQCQAPAIRPRQENFQKKHLTLSGLKGVHLDVDGLIKSAGKKNTRLTEDLKKEVARRLAKGDLRLLTKEEMIRTPGQPEMNIYMSFPPHMKSAKNGEKPAPYRPSCCTMSTWGAFSQAAQIMRDPETNYKLGTWGKGQNTSDCSDPAGWMSKAILDTVDEFVTEKLKGDKEYAAWLQKRGEKPKVATAEKPKPQKQKPRQQVAQELASLKGVQASQGMQGAAQVQQPRVQPVQYQKPVTYHQPPAIPTHCNGAVRTYIDIFATNKVHLDPANYYVLDVLAANIQSCPMYTYIIETHADLRSSFEHNEKLSALRAAAIQGHLLARGVERSQFVVQSFGEINPVSRGTSAIDHAANRRVVVRPYPRR